MIVLAGFALRLWDLGRASLWIDEILVETWTRQPFADAYSAILSYGTELPLYALVMRFFPMGSEFSLRLPSVFFGTLGVALMIAVTRRLFDRPSLALWAGAALAANPVHIALSRMARTYALAFVLALLATTFFLRMLRRPRSRPVWIAFTFSSAAVYLTHYFSLFLPLAQALTLCGSRVRGLTKRWLAAQVLAGLPVALWTSQIVILNIVSQGKFLGAHGDWLPSPTLRDLAITVPNLLTGFDGRWPAWMLVPGALAAVLGLGLGLIAAVRCTSNDCRAWRHLAILAVVPPGLVFMVSQARPAYLDRYFVISLPALVLVMVWGWQQIADRRWRVGLSALVIVSGCAVSVSDVHTGRNEKTDWRSAALHVAQAHQPGDGLLLARGVSLDPFTAYFPGAMDDLVLVMLDDPIAPPVARLWVIYPTPHMDLHRQGAFPGFDPLQPGIHPLGDWLLAHQSAILTMRSFNGVWVALVALAG